MKKYFATFVFLAFAAIFITVLCLVSFEPLDSLMKPPSSSGENLEIQRVFEDHIDQSYKLRAPLNGKYRSSYIFEDIDNDKQSEVFVFYSGEDSLETIRFCFLAKSNGKWYVIADCESSYNEIHEVDFADIDADGVMEILVGWEIYQNDLTRNLYVYSLKESMENIYNCTYIDFEVVDIDGNNNADIAVFQKKDASENISFSFMTYNKNEIVSKDSISLDASVYSIKSVVFDRPYGSSVVRTFIDGYKTDSGIVTECIYWNSKNSCLNKLHSENGSNILSTRMTNVSCQDINSDGIVEIPVEIQLENSRVITSENNESNSQNIIKWSQIYNNRVIEISNQLVYNNSDFSISFSDDWLKGITVTNDYKSGSIYFYNNVADNKVLLFELKYTSNQEEEDRLSNKYKFLTETGKGKLFYIIYNHDSTLNISRAYIENTIV